MGYKNWPPSKYSLKNTLATGIPVHLLCTRIGRWQMQGAGGALLKLRVHYRCPTGVQEREWNLHGLRIVTICIIESHDIRNSPNPSITPCSTNSTLNSDAYRSCMRKLSIQNITNSPAQLRATEIILSNCSYRRCQSCRVTRYSRRQ